METPPYEHRIVPLSQTSQIQNLYKKWHRLKVRYHRVMARYDQVWDTAPEWYHQPLHSNLITEQRRIWNQQSGLNRADRLASKLYHRQFQLAEMIAAESPRCTADIAAQLDILRDRLDECGITNDTEPVAS